MKVKYSTGYLTPQADKNKKTQQPRRSENNDISSPMPEISDSVFQKLMDCPIKRQLVLKLIASEKNNIEKYKKELKEKERQKQNASPLQKVKKKQACESPTALLRRRALEQQNRSSPLGNLVENSSRPTSATSSSSEGSSNSVQTPFGKLLTGVVAFVEVKSKGQDRSNGVKALMLSMGASVRDSFSKDVTHVVFKDGSYTTFQKAKLMNKHLVSVLWIEAIRSAGTRVSEKKFPALGTDAYDHNVSKICSQMQKEYEDIIKDELQRSLVTGTPLPTTKALIDRRRTIMTPNISRSSLFKDSSQEMSSQDKEVEQIVTKARVTGRMSMGFVQSLVDEPELTSDDDSGCDAIVNGDLITKKNTLVLPLTDVTNNSSFSMDLTNLETDMPTKPPNIRRNLFRVDKDSVKSNCKILNGSTNENLTPKHMYDLQTPKMKRNRKSDYPEIDENLSETREDSMYVRRTKSLATIDESVVDSPNNTGCRTPINYQNHSSLRILSRNSCIVSPVAPVINNNVLVQRAKTPLDKNSVGTLEKSSSAHMSSLQLSPESKTSMKNSGTVEKTLSSDMSSLKISAEKSSGSKLSSLKVSDKESVAKSSNSNMSVLQLSSDKNSFQKTSSSHMSSLISEKPVEKSSDTNMSMLQLSSEIENISKDTNKSNTGEVPKLLSVSKEQGELFKRLSSTGRLRASGSYNSVDDSFSPLQPRIFGDILRTLDTPPTLDENVTKRRPRKSLMTPRNEINTTDSYNNVEEVSSGTANRTSRRKSVVTRTNKQNDVEKGANSDHENLKNEAPNNSTKRKTLKECQVEEKNCNFVSSPKRSTRLTKGNNRKSITRSVQKEDNNEKTKETRSIRKRKSFTVLNRSCSPKSPSDKVMESLENLLDVSPKKKSKEELVQDEKANPKIPVNTNVAPRTRKRRSVTLSMNRNCVSKSAIDVEVENSTEWIDVSPRKKTKDEQQKIGKEQIDNPETSGKPKRTLGLRKKSNALPPTNANFLSKSPNDKELESSEDTLDVSPQRKPKAGEEELRKGQMDKETISGNSKQMRRSSRRKSVASLSKPASDKEIETSGEATEVSPKKNAKIDQKEAMGGQTSKPEVSGSESSSEKTRRIRKLYDPNDIVGVATVRISKLGDEEERRRKRQLVLERRETDGVIITADCFPIQTKRAIKEKPNENNVNSSDESEIEFPVKTLKKRNKNQIDASNEDEKQEPAIELGTKVILQSSRKSQRFINKPSPRTSTSSCSSDDDNKFLTRGKPKNKKVVASKLLGTTAKRRQSQRLVETIKKTKFRSPRPKAFPVTPSNYRRSTLDFQTTAEMSAKKRLKIDKRKQPSIVFTKLHKDNIIVFNQIVKKLGKFSIENEVSRKTTHLVAGEPKRTINMLRAMATGCWILKHEWVLKSLEAGKWLPEEDYEETDFSPAVQESRLHRQAFGPNYTMDVFRECEQMYVAKGSIPRCSDIRELIALCQGKVTTILRNALIVVGGYVNQPHVTCVKETWVLDSITKYKKMPLKDYLIRSDNGVII